MKKIIHVIKCCAQCPFLYQKEETGTSGGLVLVSYHCRPGNFVIASFLARVKTGGEFWIEKSDGTEYLRERIDERCPLEDYDAKRDHQDIGSQELSSLAQQATKAEIDLRQVEEGRRLSERLHRSEFPELPENIDDFLDGDLDPWEPTK